MSKYTPDLWTVVEITMPNKESYRRVLGSWYGGFSSGDSWRLSSGIVEVKKMEDHYEILNESGSTYFCGFGNIGMSGYTARILQNLKQEVEENGGSITVVEKFED